MNQTGSGQIIIFHQPRTAAETPGRLDFPEIRGFPFQNATFWGPRSCEVAIIWPDYIECLFFHNVQTAKRQIGGECLSNPFSTAHRFTSLSYVFFQNSRWFWITPNLDVSKNRGETTKMDGENNGKPYEQMDDLGVPLFLETPILYIIYYISGCLFWRPERSEAS